MRIVAAPLALEITFAIAAARRRLVRAVLGAEALHRGPSRNLRAVDQEVLIRQQAAHLLVVQTFGQELVRNLRFKQPFAVSTVGTQTGSSTPSPTNHRYSRL